MKVQIIEKGGQPEFAVLPFEDYETLLQRLEDLEDACGLREYRANPGESFPAVLVDRFLEGEKTAVKNGDELSIVPAIAGGH